MHTVLVVKRAAAVAPTLGLALQGAGFEVVEADASTAEQPAGPAVRVDLAVVDVGVPDPAGLELCREVGRRWQTPVIAVAAPTDTPDVVAFLEAGVEDYLVWPIDPSVVTARLRAVLRRGSSG